MSNPPWMPLYVRDYLADTTELTTLEHGAYLLLIMHYWQKGGLPNDDRQLANITKMRLEHWRKKRAVLEPLFAVGFRSHKRIERELQRSEAISKTNSERARQAAYKRWSNHAPSNSQAMLQNAHTQRKKDLS